MSSNLSNLGKSLPQSSPSPQPGPTTSSFESRRPVQSPSFAQTNAAPRKAQIARKQHRNQRRAGRSAAAIIEDDDFAMTHSHTFGNGTSRRGQTSITHLLDNYHAPMLVPGMDNYHTFARTYRRNPHWGSGYRPADKQRYVRANYRFIVSPDGSYSTIASDPDAQIDWANVLQVIASSQSQTTSCPICLSDPVAPRMAQCGHIFCLPCLIRYHHSETNEDVDSHIPPHKRRWRKCPICEDRIQLSDVRPVRFYAGQESPLPRPGDDVVLRLMVRSASSTLAMPREGGTEVLDVGDDIPWQYAANVMDYGRVMKANGAYMVVQYDEEIAALEKQEKEDECMFGSDGEWTQKAIKAIQNAKEAIKDLGKQDHPTTPPGGVSDEDSHHHHQDHANVPSGPKGRGKQAAGPDFFFYSAPPHLYLSPLDIRILKTKYGDFSLFPCTLLPRVEHISTGHVVDDAMRRRAKYLGHLPRGCLISFLECDWTDIVPGEILEQFADDIEKRRKRNRDKATQEEKLRQQAERIEAAAIQKTIPRYEPMSIRHDDGEPTKVDFSDADFLPLGVGGGAAAASTTPPEPRAGFAQLANLSTSPSTARTVWGTPAVQLPPSPTMTGTERDAVDDGWLKDADILADASIAAQLEALGVEDVGAALGATNGVGAGAVDGQGQGHVNGGGKGKKKKKQKITLMSTGGRRGL